MSVPEPQALKSSTIAVLHLSQTKHFLGIFLHQSYKEVLVAFSNLRMRTLRQGSQGGRSR